LLEAHGHPVLRIPERRGDVPASIDAEQTLEALSGFKPVDWLIADRYGTDRQWGAAVREAARCTMVIDDLADRQYDCDILLNQNFSTAPDSPYASLVSSGTRVLLGPRYALLRPEFAMLRSSTRARDGVVRRIVVCFGGADPQNYTGAMLQALRGRSAGIDRVDVVVGPSSPHRGHVAAQCAAMLNAVLHCPASDMGDLLARADLAIGAGGTMNWERACLGVPTIAFGIAGNQRKVLEALIEAGCVLGIPQMQIPDVESMAAWVSSALANPPLLRGLAQRSAALTDGLGAERVANLMFPATLDFRHATIDDTDLIFQCRNDPAVRAASLDSREIPREAHDAWMTRTLADPERVLLIADCGGEPQGVVRFDLHPPDATISVYRIPTSSNARLGLIRQATLWLRNNYPDIRHVVAEVLPDNTASLAAFRGAGYREAKYVLDTELNEL